MSDFSDLDIDLSEEDFNISDEDPNYEPDSDTESENSLPGPSNRRHFTPVSVVSPSPSPLPVVMPSSEQSVLDPDATDYSNIVWGDPVGNQQSFLFTGIEGMKDIYAGMLALADPIDYYEFFLDNEIINLMVEETNLYATQYLIREKDIPPNSRLHDWTPTDPVEMRKFIGLLGWMGLVKVPELTNYWSRSELFSFSLPKTVMSRNRFELLLRFWHFANNEEAAPQERLHKIDKLLQLFIKKYQHAYTPGQKICIDETMIPWRGRLSFRQYIPNKRHRYGIKMYKLCTSLGYTWNLSIYVGKDLVNRNLSASHNVVMKLIEGLLNDGRILYVDNFYTSIPLAHHLLQYKTHLVGTLRSNRKYLPLAVMRAKLKKGEIIAKESPDGITVLKWQDKRDVKMLSTCHKGNDTVVVTNSNQRQVIKPKCVIDYDGGKSPVDVSDQLASYNTSLRRCTKWYRKIAIEIIWGTSLVNAHFLYSQNAVNQNKMTITQFREKVIHALLDSDRNTSRRNQRRRTATHHLVTGEQKKRARCRNCYNKYGKNGKIVDGVKKMASQVITICDTCEDNPHFCRPCFNEKH